MLDLAQPVHYVFYWSRCRKPQYDVTDLDIMRESILNNAANNITGFLHREANFYMQYFEGPERAVSQLHKNLLTDKRHFGFQLMDVGQTQDRVFPDWSMGYSNEEAIQVGLEMGRVEPNHVEQSVILDVLLASSQDQKINGKNSL